MSDFFPLRAYDTGPESHQKVSNRNCRKKEVWLYCELLLGSSLVKQLSSTFSFLLDVCRSTSLNAFGFHCSIALLYPTLLTALVQARAMSPPRLLLVSRALQETLHCQSLNILHFTLQGKSSIQIAGSWRATLLTSCKKEGEAVRGYYCPSQTRNSNM